MTKEEYLKEHGVSERAFLIYCINVLVDDDIRINGDNINDLKGFLYELVEEHFKPKDTEEFKHFKLHSYSTLKNQTKKELTDYIKMLYHNWGVCDEQLKRVIDKAKELSDSNNELERTIHSLDCELSDVYNPKPYKFEDLKVGMWVLDRKPECEEFTFIKITRILSESVCEYLYHDKDKKVFFDNMECHAREFEENRFYPVQCANEVTHES